MTFWLCNGSSKRLESHRVGTWTGPASRSIVAWDWMPSRVGSSFQRATCVLTMRRSSERYVFRLATTLKNGSTLRSKVDGQRKNHRRRLTLSGGPYYDTSCHLWQLRASSLQRCGQPQTPSHSWAAFCRITTQACPSDWQKRAPNVLSSEISSSSTSRRVVSIRE